MHPDVDGQLIAAEEDTPAAGIAWATDCQSAHVFWDTGSGRPDEWTVFVIDSWGDRTNFDVGMSRFLVKFLMGDFESSPVAMFNRSVPVFLNWKRLRQLQEAGTDPWPHLG